MIAFDMNHEILATFLAEEDVNPGSVCKVTAPATVGSCADGDSFCGVTTTVRGGYAGVMLHGIVTVPYTGTVPGLGKTALSADGKGGVKAGSGDTYLVLDVDEDAKTIKLFL